MKTDALTEIQILKQTGRQTVTLAESPDGTKYIKRHFTEDKREIYKTLQKIRHPNIPAVYAVEWEDGTTVIEEYTEGETLGAYMEAAKPLSAKEIDRIANGVLSALTTLHAHRIIHRDVKPDNIYWGKDGRVWLIDYDIARIHRSEIRKDTETMGTFGYAPIEQYGMMPTDEKTDIYAFGVTLRTMLEYANVKGYRMKAAKKCQRLDPSLRYASIQAVKRKLSFGRKRGVLFGIGTLLVLFLAIGGIRLANRTPTKEQPEALPETQTAIGADTPNGGETESRIRFQGFTVSEAWNRYAHSENFETTGIFNIYDVWDHLYFFEDGKNHGTVLMGKNHRTEITAEAELKEGALTLSLDDGMGNTFQHEFSDAGEYPAEIIYPDRRRIIGEMICRDMDGDNVEELLVGLADCAFFADDKAVYQYNNYCIGWVIKYDEARGFILCDGEMFVEHGKFDFEPNDLRCHLTYASDRQMNVFWYELTGTKIVPHFED